MAKANVLQPYQFKGQGIESLLGQEQDSESLTKLIPLTQISLPARQPRRYFDEQALNTLAASIQEHGILTPLLVRPKKDNQYELVAGERRYRAAKALGLKEVPVQIREMSDGVATEVALLENLQREDLNPVEETEAILDLLGQRLAMSQAEVISLLNRGANTQRKSVQNVLHSPEWQAVEQVFRAVGRFTPQSFRASRLRLLKLPENVLAALREGKLEFTKAQAIACLQDQKERKSLLENVITNQLSLSQIKQHVQELKTHSHQSNSNSSLKHRWMDVYSKLTQEGLWEQPEKEKVLERIVAQLEALLLVPRSQGSKNQKASRSQVK